MHPANYHSIIREEGKPVAADKIFLLLHSTTSIWHKISEKRQTLLCHTLLFLFFCSFSEWWSFRHSPFPRKKVTKKMFLFVLLQTERKPLTVRIFPQRRRKSRTKLFRYLFCYSSSVTRATNLQSHRHFVHTMEAGRHGREKVGPTSNTSSFRCGLPWQQRYQVRRMERKLSASKKDRESSNISASSNFANLF